MKTKLLEKLTPDEPFVSRDPDYEPGYPTVIPICVKYWCLICLCFNVFVGTLSSAVLRDWIPAILACLFSLFPAYQLLFWKDLAGYANDARRKIKETRHAARL